MTVEENRKLVERSPFLLPRNYMNDQVEVGYDYSWTELDSLPDGWRIAFGSDMLEELREILIKGDYLDEYRILQIKEKFGSLRWYDNSFPLKIADEMRA